VQRSIVSLVVGLILTATPMAVGQNSKPAKKTTPADKPTVAVFHLHGSYGESPKEEGLALFTPDRVNFRELTSRLTKAGKDQAVKAIVLRVDGDSLGSAQVEEVRQIMKEIRAGGKEIYAHADSLGMSDYVLVSGASRVSLVPTADLWVQGLHGEAPYLRGLLDLLGVEPEFLHCGAYKSASEIFMRDGPSKEAEDMQNWLLDGKFNAYLQLIAGGRGVDAGKAREWIDNGPYTAEKAKAAGLIDAVEHVQDLEAVLKGKYGKDLVFNRKYGEKKAQELDLSSPFAMFKILGDMMGDNKKKKTSKDAVGIVYVEGAIALGGGSSSPFSASEGAMSTDIRKALDEAARDNSIKAVVLRVNSPGGSAVASEVILDATRRVKAKKPFVVSMGDVAGSGGYYVACASDVIFADENTITASIGVVGGKMVTTPMWKKIGVTFKSYSRGKNADLLASDKPWTPAERERMQSWMDDIYKVFKGHVVASRGDRLKQPIDELAAGRVFTGKQALERGLVDKIGSLDDAIKYIAGIAKLTDYDVRVVPEPKSFLEKILEETTGDKNDSRNLDAPLGRSRLVALAMPYLQNLDPQRVRLIKMALERLQLLNQEGAVLMMPEMRIGN
jgi:protease-4